MDFFASPSCFVLFIFVFVQKLCFPFDTLRNACFLIVCAELQEEKRKLASCHFFAGGGKQEGCLHSFFLYYLYLFVFLLFTSIIFFEIICSSFLREEVSRRVVFILYFRILWCPTMKSLYRLPVPLQVLVPVPLLAHRSKASSAGKHRAQTHIFSENEKGNKDKDNAKESLQ